MKMQKESNPPIPGLKLLTKVNKSHPMSGHVPGPVAHGPRHTCKKTKTHPLPFWNTDENMRCKIPLTKILHWTAGCELLSGTRGRRPAFSKTRPWGHPPGWPQISA